MAWALWAWWGLWGLGRLKAARPGAKRAGWRLVGRFRQVGACAIQWLGIKLLPSSGRVGVERSGAGTGMTAPGVFENGIGVVSFPGFALDHESAECLPIHAAKAGLIAAQ